MAGSTSSNLIVFKGLEVLVQYPFPYEENEWSFNFRKTVALYKEEKTRKLQFPFHDDFKACIGLRWCCSLANYCLSLFNHSLL